MFRWSPTTPTTILRRELDFQFLILKAIYLIISDLSITDVIDILLVFLTEVSQTASKIKLGPNTHLEKSTFDLYHNFVSDPDI